MSRPSLTLVLTAVLAAVSAPAAAQTPLSLSEAIDAAVAGNPSLRALQAAGDQARDLARSARADRFPRIEFSESWHRSTQPVAAFGTLLNAGRFTAADFAVDRLNAPGQFDGFSRRVGISQILVDGGRARALAALAARESASAHARSESALADLAVQVTEAYGNVIAAESAVTAAKAGLDWAIEDQGRASARRSAGTATDADVLAASVHVADMRQRHLQAGGDLVTARAVLNSLMAVPLDRVFLVSVPATPASSAAVPSLDELTRDAQAGRVELRDAASGIAAADAGRRLARSALWPALAANAGYEWNGLNFADRQSAWTVGAELRWSISLGGAEAAQLAASRAGAAAARATRDAAAAAVELDVVVAYQRWLVALAAIDVSRAVADEAREAQRIVRQRYSAGMASMTDVLAAASAWLAADTQATRNRVGLINAWAALERAAGHALRPATR